MGEAAPFGFEYLPECVSCAINICFLLLTSLRVFLISSTNVLNTSLFCSVMYNCLGFARDSSQIAIASNQTSPAPPRANLLYLLKENSDGEPSVWPSQPSKGCIA